MIKKGNATVYEWRTGTAPEQVERPTEIKFNFGDDENSNENEEINFDIDAFNVENVDTSQIDLNTGDQVKF